MIKHFSKWLELMFLLDYNSEGVVYAFLDKMFSRFGALAEVFTDQGMEFLKGFPGFVWEGIDKSSDYFTRSS